MKVKKKKKRKRNYFGIKKKKKKVSGLPLHKYVPFITRESKVSTEQMEDP